MHFTIELKQKFYTFPHLFIIYIINAEDPSRTDERNNNNNNIYSSIQDHNNIFRNNIHTSTQDNTIYSNNQDNSLNTKLGLFSAPEPVSRTERRRKKELELEVAVEEKGEEREVLADLVSENILLLNLIQTYLREQTTDKQRLVQILYKYSLNSAQILFYILFPMTIWNVVTFCLLLQLLCKLDNAELRYL